MVATDLEPVVLGVLLFFGLVVATTAVVGVVLVSLVRRRWRSLRNHGVVVAGATAWEVASNLRPRRAGPLSPTDLRTVPARRVRKELWQAVSAAEAAVRAADHVDAPIADLPAVAQRMHLAAIDLDQVVRIDLARPVPSVVADKVAELVRAADDVREAAVLSASTVHAARVAELTREANDELVLLEAGHEALAKHLPPVGR